MPDSDVTIEGTADPGAEVRRDKLGPDDSIIADEAGVWRFNTDLDLGPNEFEFFLQGASDVRVKLTVVFNPVAPTPSSEAAPEPSPTATSTPEEASETLPGVTSGDLEDHLKDWEVVCTGPERGETMLLWSCSSDDGSLVVMWMGLSATRIRSISGTVIGPDELASDFLGFLATACYSSPQDASDWVEENIATGGEVVMDCARLILQGPAGGRFMDIVAVGAE